MCPGIVPVPAAAAAAAAASHCAELQAELYALGPGVRGASAVDGAGSGGAPQQACDKLL